MGSTICDVAARAHVSTATVSRALRGLPNVSGAARLKVLNAAQELGYVISPYAQALATGHTNTMAIVAPTVKEWFFGSAVDGAQRYFQSLGIASMLHSFVLSRGKPSFKLNIDMLAHRVDGIMVIGTPLQDDEIATVLDLGVPAISIADENPPLVTVGLDDFAAGYDATCHLLGLGHKVIAHISGSREELSSRTTGGRRIAGWEKALEEAGIEVEDDLLLHSYYDVKGGRDATYELMKRRPDVTAIFAASDAIAHGVVLSLQDIGLDVPGDVSVIGIDGESNQSGAPLTTIRQHPDEYGKQAAKKLIHLVSTDEQVEPILVRGQLVEGRTSSFVKRGS